MELLAAYLLFGLINTYIAGRYYMFSEGSHVVLAFIFWPLVLVVMFITVTWNWIMGDRFK
jgi:hypothetical protein